VTEPWSTSTDDPPAAAQEAATAAAAGGSAASRRISRRRTLPGGRAVLGALLVALAVVGVVATHLSATATPRDRYLVAAAAVPAGTFLGDAAMVRTTFRQVAVDLPAELAARAVHVDDAETLVGRRVLAALEPGDLLLASGLAAAGEEPGTSTFTFAVPADAAVGGALTVGDRVDVLATAGTGNDATTAYVIRAAPLSSATATGGGLGGDVLRLTVELARQADVQALAHALATAEVVVVRSPDATSPAPAPYRFDPSAAGVTPTDADERTPEERGTLPLVPTPQPTSPPLLDDGRVEGDLEDVDPEDVDPEDVDPEDVDPEDADAEVGR
jgi:hypothetical protein